jgi:DNA-binding MarR family transcriptional regulator
MASKRLKRAAEIPGGDDVAPLGEVLSFMRLLWAVTHGLESTSKRMLSELGVTGPQRLVLRIVGQNPNMAPGELAKVLHIDPSSLTGVLHRLEQSRLLQRQRDPEDGRRSALTLSPIGRQINGRRAGTVEAAVQRAMSSIPAAKLRAAEEVLKKLAFELDSSEQG